MGDPAVHISATPDEVMSAVSSWLVTCTQQDIRERGRSVWAISGGSTPIPLYQRWAHDSDAIPWTKVQLFLVDERDVFPSDPLSSYGMIQKTLLDRLPVSPTRVYPWPVTGSVPEGLAYYRAALSPLPRTSGFPVLDTAMVGMGGDGHTASVFPASPQEHSSDWVAHGPGPNAARWTLTLPLLGHARRVAFLVTGSDKAQKVQECLGDPHSPWPAAQLSRLGNEVHWFLDQDSAAHL